MAKPDLQAVYVDPNDSTLRSLKGKLGLGRAFDNLPVFANNAAALSGDLVNGDLYRTSLGAIHVVFPT
jgi:hypothetical protein